MDCYTLADLTPAQLSGATTVEGLPVAPEYHEAKLGMKHGSGQGPQS